MARTRLVTLGLGLLLSTACTRNGGPMEFFAPPPPPEVAYVSPDGGDLADGTEEAPFASLRRALSTTRPRIVLLPGVFPEPEVVVNRPVRIEGSQPGAATLQGHLFITSEQVQIQDLEITDGLAVHLAQDFHVQNATISASRQEDTISLVSSRGRLRDLNVTCGQQTCLQTTTATVRINGLRARPQSNSKRILRVESSSVAIVGLYAQGGDISQLQAGLRSHLSVRSATLAGSLGNGLVAVQDATVKAQDLHIVGPQRFAVLVQHAQLELRHSTIEASHDVAVGVAGGVLTVRSSTITGASAGALSLSKNAGVLAKVTLIDGVIRHRGFDGALVSGGRLTVFGTRFEGEGPPSTSGGDAIIAHGVDAELDLHGVHILRPAGFGVVFNADAIGAVGGRIIEPGRGGVLIDDVALEPVTATALHVQGCRGGSGVVALKTPSVLVQGGSVTGCSEAGYLAGGGSTVQVTGARALNNREYGFAAFGGSTLRVRSSTASGSRWSSFASCGDGARIEIGPGVVLDGPSVTCP